MRDLLGREARLLDRAHLALGALGDLADGGRDLDDGAARLLGRRGHLLRGGRDRAGGRRDVADERGEADAALGVRRERLDGLGVDLVERARDVADLVGAGILDRRRLRLGRHREVALARARRGRC